MFRIKREDNPLLDMSYSGDYCTERKTGSKK